MPKLHHLRDFAAIARAESVRSAARSLGLTQPALTRSLRELELEIGGVLCERHARGIVLTPLQTPRSTWEAAFMADPVGEPDNLWGDMPLAEGWD